MWNNLVVCPGPIFEDGSLFHSPNAQKATFQLLPTCTLKAIATSDDKISSETLARSNCRVPEYHIVALCPLHHFNDGLNRERATFGTNVDISMIGPGS